MVIGSILTWIEAILLYLGAKKVTTLEYAEVKNEHPKLNPITPEQLRYRITTVLYTYNWCFELFISSFKNLIFSEAKINVFLTM